MKNLLESKKLTIVLGVVFIFLLFVLGFSLFNFGNSEEVIVPIEDDSQQEEPVVEEPVVEEPVVEEPVVMEVELMEFIPPLNLDPHDRLDSQQLSSKGGVPLFGPYYQKDFRIQPISFERTSNGNIVTFEIGNTSSKDIVLTNDNIRFVRLVGDNNIAGSKLEKSPIIIKPNEIVKFKLTATNHEAFVIEVNPTNGEYGTFSYFFTPSKKIDIVDTKPYHSRQTGIDPEVSYYNEIAGNNKFKFIVTDLILTKNSQIGDFKKPDNSTIALVKVKVANTTDTPIEIENIRLSNANVHQSSFDSLDLSPEILNYIPNSLPSKIEPNSIVEGYVPALLKDVNRDTYTFLKTTKGILRIGDLWGFDLWVE